LKKKVSYDNNLKEIVQKSKLIFFFQMLYNAAFQFDVFRLFDQNKFNSTPLVRNDLSADWF
jgi:hypothetical protein